MQAGRLMLAEIGYVAHAALTTHDVDEQLTLRAELVERLRLYAAWLSRDGWVDDVLSVLR